MSWVSDGPRGGGEEGRGAEFSGAGRTNTYKKLSEENKWLKYVTM